MATISLFTGSGVYDHKHIEEDISSQIDGYKYIFTTALPYIPNSLFVVYNGVTYYKNNDFLETGPQEFTFLTGDPFPPELDSTLVAVYRMILS